MFAFNVLTYFKRERKVTGRRVNPNKAGVDEVTEHVKRILGTSNQQIILMAKR